VYTGGPRGRVRALHVRVYSRDVPAPRNGRGRRECWRAATRRLSPVRGLLLPSPTTVRGNGGGWLSPTVGTDGESR